MIVINLTKFLQSHFQICFSMRKAPVKQYGKKWIDQEIRKFILKNKFSQFTIFYKDSKKS